MDIGENHGGIGIAVRAGVYAKRAKSGVGVSGGASDDGFEAPRRGDQGVLDDLFGILRIVVGKGHAVHGDDFEFLRVELKIDVLVGGGVDDAPELTLSGIDADGRTKLAVHGEDACCGAGLVAARGRLGVHFLEKGGGVGIVLGGYATDDQYLFAQIAYFGVIALHTFDDDCAGHAVERLAMAFTVGMGMIPEKAGRVIARDFDDVVKSLAGHGHHVDDVVLRGLRRNFEAVEMEIRHVFAGIDGAGFRGVVGEMVDIGDFQGVAGVNANGRSDGMAFVGEGIFALCVQRCIQSEGDHVGMRAGFQGLDQRDRAIHRSCGGDEEKRGEVTTTAKIHGKSRSFLHQ